MSEVMQSWRLVSQAAWCFWDSWTQSCMVMVRLVGGDMFMEESNLADVLCFLMVEFNQ